MKTSSPISMKITLWVLTRMLLVKTQTNRRNYNNGNYPKRNSSRIPTLLNTGSFNIAKEVMNKWKSTIFIPKKSCFGSTLLLFEWKQPRTRLETPKNTIWQLLQTTSMEPLTKATVNSVLSVSKLCSVILSEGPCSALIIHYFKWSTGFVFHQ